jgi:hypothetical protein
MKKQKMFSRDLKVTVVVILGFVLPARNAVGQERSKNGRMPLDEIRQIHNNTTLPESVIVEKLIGYLDQQIGRTEDPADTRASGDLAVLLGMLWQPYSYLDKPIRRRTLAGVLGVSDTFAKAKHPEKLRVYLNIALAMAGGEASQEDLVTVLNDPKTSGEILRAVLMGMIVTSVPRAAIPRIKQLANDPTNYIDAPDFGPPRPKRVFPTRDLAFECLKNAGVNVERKVIDDDKVDPQHKVRLTTTVIVIKG